MKFLSFVIIASAFVSASAFAGKNKCANYIYGNGTLRKYEYLPNTMTENTQKHGSSTSSAVSTESSTAAVDPGVLTGVSNSYSQFSSTEGVCKWGGFFASAEQYKMYIAQNIEQIKDEMALGTGGHLDMLASVHNCNTVGRSVFPNTIKQNYEQFVDFNASESEAFAETLNSVVEKNMGLDCTSAQI